MMRNTTPKLIAFVVLFALWAILFRSFDAQALGAWTAQYWNNTDLSGTPVVTENNVSYINFNWNYGSPHAAIQNDYFSARYSSTQTFNTDTYTFHIAKYGGARVFFDSELIYDGMQDGEEHTSIERAISAGSHYITIEYYANTGIAALWFYWMDSDPETTDESVPPTPTSSVYSTPTPSGSPTMTRTSTNTPTPSATPVFQCSKVVLNAALTYGITLQTVTFTLSNQLPYPVELRRVALWWEYANGYTSQIVQSFSLNGGTIWAGSQDPPLTDIGSVVSVGSGTATPVVEAPEQPFATGANLMLIPGNNTLMVRFNNGPNLNASVMPPNYFNGTTLYYDDPTASTDCAAVHNVVIPTATPTLTFTPGQWTAQYWNNITLSGDPVYTEPVNAIDFFWDDFSPHPLVNDDNFSSRFTSTQLFEDGLYTFRIIHRRGARLYLDGNLILDRWTLVSGTSASSVDIEITAGEHEVVVEHYTTTGDTTIFMAWEKVGAWTAEYWNNTDLSGAPVLSEALSGALSFNWGTSSPRPGVVNDDNFSARFTTTQTFPGGFHEFVVSSDDGVRVFLDGVLVLDRFVGRPLTTDRFYLDITPGTHSVIVEYFEGIDQAALQVGWTQLISVTELSVQLQGRPTPPHQQWQTAAVVTFAQSGATLPIVNIGITLDFNGKILLKNIPPGEYRVWIKGNHTLAIAQNVTITGGLNTFDLGTLPEGDADGDNRVILTDFSLLAAAYGTASGQPGFDARADFNNDYQVNLVDFSLLAANYGLQGAAP